MPQRFRDKTIVGSKINEAGRDDEGIESFSDSIRIIGGRAGFVCALIALLILIVMAISS
ncbi:MAG: hypothetical protein ACLQIJ_21870 [Polyangia bacterium]